MKCFVRGSPVLSTCKIIFKSQNEAESAGTFLYVFEDNSVIIHLVAAIVVLLLTSDRKSSG